MADPRERKNYSDIRKEYEQLNNYQQLLLNLQKEELNNISGIFDIKKKMLISQQEYNAEYEKLKNILGTYQNTLNDGFRVTQNTQKLIEKEANQQQQLVDIARKKWEWNVKLNNTLSAMNLNYVGMAGHVSTIWNFLQMSDKIIRETALNLGLSGSKSEMMRDSFEKSAGFVARFGGNLSDVQDITQQFVETSGRAKVFTAGMVEDIFLIGKSSGLGVNNAAQLAANFELMGLNTKATFNFVESIVETSERMGVSSTKVLKDLNGNFLRLQKFTFQSGVQGMATMLEYSNKMKINVSETLDSAEKARTLEGAISMFSELQVLGGKFAQIDPFQMLYLSRNAPDEYNKKINEMVKGIATFKKNADGVFETFISPLDIDRLKVAAKSLGVSEESLSLQARRMAEISAMRKQMGNSNFSKQDRELIEGLAVLDSKKGTFSVAIGDQMKDINSLTKDQLALLKVQSKSLEERSLAAQNFDSAFQNTIKDLKTSLLPLLHGINSVLEFIRPLAIKMGEFANSAGPWGKIAAAFTLLAGALVSGVVAKTLSGGIGNIAGRLTPGGLGEGRSVGLPAMGSKGTLAAGKAGMMGGVGKLASSAGIGVAAVGLGEGINLAAGGLSKLAESMSKLDKTQIWALPATMLAMAGAFWVMVPAIGALGEAGTVGSLGLLALGASVALIGGSIFLATTGIGNMSEGLAKLVTAGKDSGKSMLSLSGGIAALSASMVEMTFGIGGVATFSLLMNNIAKNAVGIERVGDAFGNIKTVLSGTKEQFEGITNLIASINNLKSTNLTPFAELGKLFDKGIKMKFDDDKINLKNDITLTIDGQKLASFIDCRTFNVKGNDQNKGYAGSSSLKK